VSGLRRVITVSQPGRPLSGKSAPDRKSMGMSSICMTTWKDSIFWIRLATNTPKVVIATAIRSSRAIISNDEHQGEVDTHQRSQHQHDGPLGGGDGGASDRLAEHQGRAAHRGDQHLAQETEFAVPHDRKRREHRRHDHAHGHDAGVDELAEVEPPVVPTRPLMP
jgi:hypothetical protein